MTSSNKTSQSTPLNFLVPTEINPQRIDVFLSEQTIGNSPLSRSQIKNLILNGCVAVNGSIVAKAGQTLLGGESIAVYIPETKVLDLAPRDLELSIIYEDDDLAVLDKPAGISVHPSETETGPTVVHGLLHALKSLSSIGGVARPGIVHRIDKGTSGLLVISKTDIAHASLSLQFKEHTIERAYLCLVYGSPKNSEGKIDTLFGRHPVHRKQMSGRVDKGKRAVTHWKKEEDFKFMSLIRCQLETGRTHQIRAHLCELGFPIVGDPIYGNHEKKAVSLAKAHPQLRPIKDLKHQLLHAKVLGFQHPRTKKTLRFESNLPSDFLQIIALIKKECAKNV